jgi:hypothetical protein
MEGFSGEYNASKNSSDVWSFRLSRSSLAFEPKNGDQRAQKKNFENTGFPKTLTRT